MMLSGCSSPKLLPYLLSVVEEEQRGISPDAVLRADLIVLRTVHLGHKCIYMFYQSTMQTQPLQMCIRSV